MTTFETCKAGAGPRLFVVYIVGTPKAGPRWSDTACVDELELQLEIIRQLYVDSMLAWR